MEKSNIQDNIFLLDDDIELTEAFKWVMKPLSINLFIYQEPYEFLKEFIYNQPSCVILDVRLNGMSGLRVQEILKVNVPTVPIIFITAHGDIPMAVRAMKEGALDFFTKPFNNQLLLETIQDALVISRQEIQKKVIQEKIIKCINALTKREKEVAMWIIRGEHGKKIADRLNISLNTVDAHRAKIIRKMQMKSSAELIKTILKNDLETHLQIPF